jgi:hypothetical protein
LSSVKQTAPEFLYGVRVGALVVESELQTRQDTGDLIKVAAGLAIFAVIFVVIAAFFNLPR